MARWNSNNPNVNIDLNVSNIYLNGDWPNMSFHFDCDFNYYCRGSYASMSHRSVNFHTQVTGYDTEIKTADVSFQLSSGQESARYGANYYNPQMNNARQRDVSVHAWISNGTFTGGGYTTVSSPTIDNPSDLKLTITNIKENSCVVTHSFQNVRNYWFVRLWDRNTRTYYNLNQNNGSSTTTITGLKPNTQYNFELWACGRDGVEYADAHPAQTIETLGKSSIGNKPAYTIGNTFPLSITGYSDSFTHDVTFTVGSYSFTRTGLKRGNITITPTQEENNAMYAQMKTTTSIALTIILSTFVNGVSIGSNSGMGTVHVNANTCAPVLHSFTYRDVDEIALSMTQNEQYIIQNISKLCIEEISATPKHEASILKYRIDVGEENYESITNTIQTNRITKHTNMSVKVIDSRGLQGVLNKEYALYVPYVVPVIKEFFVVRRNAVETTSILSFSGTFSPVSIEGVNRDHMQSITYRYKATNSTTWSEPVEITPTIDEQTVSFQNIIGDFDADQSYNFELSLKDKANTTTMQSILIVGKPALSIRKGSVGIGKVPITGRGLDVTGNIYANDIRLAATDETLTFNGTLGANVNLNTLTKEGFYHQDFNSNTTLALNYPLVSAGLLTVINRTYIYQTYMTYEGYGFYWRTYYNGKWNTWYKAETNASTNIEKKDILYEGSIRHQQATNITMGKYKRLRIYAIFNRKDLHIAEMDIVNSAPQSTISGYPYGMVTLCGASDSTQRIWSLHCIVNSARTSFKVHRIAYRDGMGSSTDHNDPTSYVFRIDGVYV